VGLLLLTIFHSGDLHTTPAIVASTSKFVMVIYRDSHRILGVDPHTHPRDRAFRTQTFDTYTRNRPWMCMVHITLTSTPQLQLLHRCNMYNLSVWLFYVIYF